MTSTDTNALQAAFLRGFEAGVRYREPKEEPKFPQYSAVRAGEEGIGPIIADPKLIGERAVGGVSSGTIASIVTAVVSGLIGLGLGSAVGAPIQGAAAGALLGGAAAYPVGQAKGQLDADKQYLADKGYRASLPIPIKELLLRPSLSSVLPLSSYARIQRQN